MILGIVVIALVLALAYPIKEYVGQRSEIAALEQDRREAQDRVDALTERQRQLLDPAYIEQQARARLDYAMPGDRIFVVVDTETDTESDAAQSAADDPDGDGATESTAPPADGDSWLERLGESLRQADAG